MFYFYLAGSKLAGTSNNRVLFLIYIFVKNNVETVL